MGSTTHVQFIFKNVQFVGAEARVRVRMTKQTTVCLEVQFSVELSASETYRPFKLD